jgi:predicted metalloprotease
MQWEGQEESENVEDRRGEGGGLSRGAMIGGAGGIGGVILVVLALVFGVDPRQLGIGGGGGGGGQQVARDTDPDEERLKNFAATVMKETEVVWEDQFRRMGKNYPKPTLVLFREHVETGGCGPADSGVGPFYCPADSKIYIDLSFYQVLERKLGSPGEFARAYVLAHEVGHHVQRLLGYSARADEVERTGSKVDANRMSVRRELQADYLAGVWAHYAREKFPKMLEKGDIESATNAAFHIGDDFLQKQAGRQVNRETFTHGTARQRQRWFLEGYNSGSVPGAKRLFDLPYNEL